MTTPGEEQPQTDAPATPSVSTAPARARWRFGTVPSRLGRARTSTVVLALLFVGFFVLYVYVRPPTAATTTGGTSDVTAPVPPATTSEAPATTETPTPEPTTTPPTDTPTEESTPLEETTTPAGTTPTPGSAPTTSRSTTVSVPQTTVVVPTT